MDVPVDITGVTLTTERLLLRPLSLDDLEDFHAYASVPGVGEMAGWPHHRSMDESRQILQGIIGGKEVLAIVHTADQKVIGTVGIHKSWTNDTMQYGAYRARELGYVLSKAYWGQGLMPEAVRAVILYCFSTLKLEAVTCCHFAHNAQSRRVIEKLGFRFVRESIYDARQIGKVFKDKQYILLREDFTADAHAID